MLNNGKENKIGHAWGREPIRMVRHDSGPNLKAKIHLCISKGTEAPE